MRDPDSHFATRNSRPIVFCDFDGTITQLDVTDQILSQFAHPSWREIEGKWVRGLMGSRECLERQMALVQAPRKELNSLLNSIPIDSHFAKFYRFTRKRALPFYMVSDGFDCVIRSVMKRAGIRGPFRNGSEFFASALRIEGRRFRVSFPHSPRACDHGCATCKAAILRRLGRGHFPIIFIGDGLSDRFAVAESDLVFAKKQLLSYCHEHAIVCQPFESLAEVEAAIAKLFGVGRAKPQRQALAVAL